MMDVIENVKFKKTLNVKLVIKQLSAHILKN